MYRFVVDPENQVLPDLAAKLPGRGLWIKADRFSLQSAIEKKLFDKITRQNLKIKEGLIIECLSAFELGEAFGRQNAIHCAVTPGGLAKRIVDEAHRLKGLRRNFGEKSPERKRQLNER